MSSKSRRILFITSPILVALVLAVLPLLGAQADRRPEIQLGRPSKGQLDWSPASDSARAGSKSLSTAATLAITVQVGPGVAPRFSFWLAQNYPNPIVNSTDIWWSCGMQCNVTLKIYSVQGRELATLFRGPQDAGLHRMRWSGKDASGKPLGPGVYFYRIVAGSFVETRRLVISR